MLIKDYAEYCKRLKIKASNLNNLKEYCVYLKVNNDLGYIIKYKRGV